MNVMINPFGTLTNPQPKKSKRNPTNNILPTLFLHVATINPSSLSPTSTVSGPNPYNPNFAYHTFLVWPQK